MCTIQSLKFLTPVYVDDTITAVATVVGKLEEKYRVVIQADCYTQKAVLPIVGEGQEYIMYDLRMVRPFIWKKTHLC